MNCNCNSNKSFKECCEPYLSGQKFAPTAEALMRSRYTAYTLKKVDYIQKTLAQESQAEFSLKDAKEWANNTEWLGLEVLSVKKGAETDTTGVVEFTAKFKESGKTLEHHEVSQFKKDKSGHWVFVDGDAHTHEEGHEHGHHHHEPRQPVVRESAKIGRNDPCHCGSGKKFKRCHGSH